RLQAENRAAIVKKVELRISAPTELLKCSLVRSERLIPAYTDNGQIGFQKRIPAITNERKSLRSIPFQIIEENAAHPPRLSSVWQKEIFVTPFFEARVIRNRGMPITGLLPDSMEMNHILATGIIRSQI